MSTVHALFDSVRVGHLELGNRMVVAPMTRISATADGMATDRMARYYSRFAAGAFGLIITEGVYTDRAFAQGYAGQPGLTSTEQALAWRPVVRAVHEQGGKIFAQLMHAGALSQANPYRTETVGPSAIQPRGAQMSIYRGAGRYATPRAMTEREIHDAIDGFARAAERAVHLAGFDGIEIHGANGYLLDQFLTRYTNERSDLWGGSIENRLRISTRIAHAIRSVLGADVPVGIRISQAKVNDFDHKWAGGESDALAIFSELARAPLDFLHITEFEAWRPAFNEGGASLVNYARQGAPGLCIIANGGLHAPPRALEILDHGADLVALGRGALANPDWPMRVARNQAPRPLDESLLKPLGDIKDAETQDWGDLPRACNG